VEGASFPRHPELPHLSERTCAIEEILSLAFAGMDGPAYARRTDGGYVRRATHKSAEVIASTWRAPKQRRLALAISAAMLSALAFARVAEDYLTNDPLARWDVSFARWLSGERSTVGTDFFRVLTFFGSPAVALAISAIVFVVLYRRRHLVDAALLPVVLGGAELLNLILKLSFHRTRPEVGFVDLETYSFPSGHAMMATAAYGAFLYLAWSHFRTGRERLLLAIATVVLVALICFSRLYLGVHYLSDVLAGVAGGAFWLAVSIALQTVYGEPVAARLTDSRADRLARRVTRS
jgi:undecaprenyl-diphosphatase